MELAVAIELIEKGIGSPSETQVWADLGAGTGLFTKALAKCLKPGSTIYAIDREDLIDDCNSLSIDITIKKLKKDFVKDELTLEPLNGVLMANSLHFVNDKGSFLDTLRKILKPSGRLVLVEYNTDTANRWVPYPISFSSLQKLSVDSGFRLLTKLAEHPSLYNRANLYSAVLLNN